MISFRMCMASIWEILILACTLSVVSSDKCKYDNPFIKIPVQLTELNDNTNVYTIVPEATSFIINCSSTDPVLWNIFPKSAYENLSVSYHSERQIEVDNGTHQEVLCHTVSLKFHQIDEGLTGRYTCEKIESVVITEVHPAEIYIFGGAGEIGSKGYLINRGKSMQANFQDNDKKIDKWFLMVIPCALNYPTANLTVEMLINKQAKIAQSHFGFTSERIIHGTTFVVLGNFFKLNRRRSDDRLIFKSTYESVKIYESLQIGVLINCYTTRENPKDIVEIELKSPLISHTPSRLNMTINVNYNQLLIFKCKSRKPLSVTTNWEREISKTSQSLPGLYWTYQEEVKIVVPGSYHRFEADWHSIDLKITCALINETAEHVIWNYKLMNSETWGWMDPEKGKTLEILPSGIRFESKAPNTAAGKFVPCATFNECQIKSRLLFLSDSRFEISGFELGSNSFVFRIPENTSGLVRCFDYDSDVNEIVYVGLDGLGYQSQYLLSSRKQQNMFEEKHIVVFTNVSEVLEGDIVSVTCSIPLMLMVSHPQWEFTFRNKTDGIILDKYVVSSRGKAERATFFMTTEIQVPTFEVIGIACTNQQIVTATPVEWSGGVLLKNLKTTTELRRESIPIQVKVKPPENKPANSNPSTSLTVGFLSLVILLVIIFSLVIQRLRKQQNIIEKLREEEIQLFKEGNSQLISDTESANRNAQNMPYDDNYEIDLLNLNIDYITCLGSGEFGMVYKATIGSTNSKPVAVKCVKPGASANYIRAAMCELKVMLFIKSHENVVKIIGACTQELIRHKLLVVMEFYEKGDLYNYLRKHSEGFVSLVKDGKLFENYDNSLNPESRSSRVLSTMDIFKWAGQIANGMKYISSLKIIHGDLAARNVLLDSSCNAKISDFGLSKKLYEYSNYVRKNQTPLPWRWLAVESLTFTEFSIASDVWAYGITLWELFSLGGIPYPGQQFNSEFVSMISSGFRLPLPQYATYDMYNLMLNCWREIPAERPSFLEIHFKLEPASYEYHHL